ncbi:MAG: N-acetylmuramoyl-L-alanine amidase [Synergistaceae bacterium]|nr:N-acetylmuramoyl-L-alanine amidase [Synergistaceae bacterium]
MQGNKKWICLMLAAAAIMIFAAVAIADTLPLYYGEVKKGDVTSRKNPSGGTDVAIEEVISSLGLARTGNQQAIVVMLDGKKMEFWSGSSAVRSAGALVSLPSPIYTDGGHWWADSKSMASILDQFYTSIGKKPGMSWGQPTQLQEPAKTDKKTQDTKAKAESKDNKPAPKSEDKKQTQTAQPTQIEEPLQEHALIPDVKDAFSGQKKRPVVVLDAGHGGHDPGASGNGTIEKVINLKAVLTLGRILEQYGVDVRYSRRTDVFLKLAERTAFANDSNANVFVSMHCNAMPRGKNASGIEFYIMAPPTDRDAMRLAIYENKEISGGAETSKEVEARADKKTQLLLKILGDMQQNGKISESTTMTEVMHSSARASGLSIRKVRQAPFFVLRGAGMPAVLIEMGYVTNSSDAAKLRSQGYLNQICGSFAKGIVSYIKENPVTVQ